MIAGGLTYPPTEESFVTSLREWANLPRSSTLPGYALRLHGLVALSMFSLLMRKPNSFSTRCTLERRIPRKTAQRGSAILQARRRGGGSCEGSCENSRYWAPSDRFQPFCALRGSCASAIHEPPDQPPPQRGCQLGERHRIEASHRSPASCQAHARKSPPCASPSTGKLRALDAEGSKQSACCLIERPFPKSYLLLLTLNSLEHRNPLYCIDAPESLCMHRLQQSRPSGMYLV